MDTPEGKQHLADVKKHLGITHEESFGNSERMLYRKLHTAGGEKSYFLKKVKTEQLQKQIQVQAMGAKALGELINSDLVQTEEVIAWGPDWILTNWIEGGPMMHPDEVGDSQNAGRIVEFAKVLAFIDNQAILQPGLKGKELCYGSNTPSFQYSERTKEKCRALVQRGVSESLLNEVIARVDRVAAQLMPAWQHGDLTPWHILKGKGGWVVIDCEHVHDNWPRYYDLANAYSQFYVRFDRADLANLLVEKFQQFIGTDVTESIEFRAMVLMRNLGRAIEYQNDPELLNRAIEQTRLWKNKV